jgi:N-hydroxyarylamine O-acetyltransferase
MTDDRPNLDLPAYLRRIGHDGPLEPTLSVLESLHTRHATTIPFENLDIQLGRPVRIDLESLQDKIVRGRRGGYCFEQNTLFAAVLRAIGFRVTTLAARVRYLNTGLPPRTHMILKVDLPEGAFLADVGFGGHGLTSPLKLVMNEPRTSTFDTYRLREEGHFIVLQALIAGDFNDLYAFTLEEHYPVDYEVANHYTSTHPTSRFVQNVMATRTRPDARYVLLNRELGVRRGGVTERRTLDDDELIEALRRHFDLDFPAGTRFQCLARPKGDKQ